MAGPVCRSHWRLTPCEPAVCCRCCSLSVTACSPTRPPSMEWPRREHWSGWLFSPPGDLPGSGIESSVCCTGRQILYPEPTQGSLPLKKKKKALGCYVTVKPEVWGSPAEAGVFASPRSVRGVSWIAWVSSAVGLMKACVCGLNPTLFGKLFRFIITQRGHPGTFLDRPGPQNPGGRQQFPTLLQ